jgi:hypothetical protein
VVAVATVAVAVATADFSIFHSVLFRAESHVSICKALANALARMVALMLLLLLLGLERVTVLVVVEEEFIMIQYDIH